jgi:hypothetical protein
LGEALERCVRELAEARVAVAEERTSIRLLSEKLTSTMQQLAAAVRAVLLDGMIANASRTSKESWVNAVLFGSSRPRYVPGSVPE